MAQPKRNSKLPLPPLSRRKLWLFRGIAVIGLPLLLFAALEFILRWSGFSHPTSFLLSDRINGQDVFVSNPKFGWRFFGEQQSRAPQTFVFPRQKAPGTIRVFVFGESAAFGDPQPDFGLPRMLQALLSERYPATHFEVINAAMTAINSHVVLPIARDCAKADGDIWVVYMGNNEVVGPFGAGTVFGSQTPPLPMIRASLALKTTRTGQMLDQLLRRATPPPADKSEWGGMLMFLENQVTWGDPRLTKMYQHFEHNLSDIIKAGQRAGAGVVVSTVAVNLRDCAPFASDPLTSLNESEKTRWRDWFQRGSTAQAAGKIHEALTLFGEAEQLQNSVAELRFRQGQCALALGDTTKAQTFFQLARDLDSLRFRCDSKLNAITRRLASGRETERVTLVDVETEFAKKSPNELPGAELFYEHVHLTFAGNHLLAQRIAESVATMLPETVRQQSGARTEWATAEQCARRLGWSAWTHQSALSEITGRLADPPFTHQLNHDVELTRISSLMKSLAATTEAPSRDAEQRCAEALKFSPDDPAILARLAGLLEANGKLDEALVAAKRVTDLQPHNVEGWNQLGVFYVRRNRNEEAAAMFRECLTRDPNNVFTLNSLAQVLVRLDHKTEAREAYERAIALKPGYGTAHLGLGRLLEDAGQAGAAEQHYAEARKHRVNRPADLALLARFCQAKGWLADAATNYSLAINLNPLDGALQLDAGRCAATLEQHDSARKYFAAAVALLPESGEAHFMLGRALGRNHDDQRAVEQFQQAVRLLPDVVEARLNLGVALMNLGQQSEAIAVFEEVLKRQPGNATAAKNLALLRLKSP